MAFPSAAPGGISFSAPARPIPAVLPGRRRTGCGPISNDAARNWGLPLHHPVGLEIPAWKPSPNRLGDGVVLRSKVDCLRICEQGPVAVVYPEGVWYRGVTPEVLDMIIDQHLIGGRIVEEYAFARGALGR